MSPFVLLQYLLPKVALSRAAGWLADARAGAATQAAIRAFISRYGVDMSQAQDADPAAYASFNDFFTRALKSGARPLATADLLSPADGTISQLGRITGENLFQAKGHHYTLQALLGSAQWAAPFVDGHFATVYLSPRDYHRVHMPCAGQLTSMQHIPGELFSVNPATVAGVPGLFARNERLVCRFEGPHGPFVMVLVGATIVGSIATVWSGRLTRPKRAGGMVELPLPNNPAAMAQGDEMGRFLLGSTVILLHAPGPLIFEPWAKPGAATRMGQALAHWTGR